MNWYEHHRFSLGLNANYTVTTGTSRSNEMLCILMQVGGYFRYRPGGRRFRYVSYPVEINTGPVNRFAVNKVTFPI
jgi:hypothetical protein